jgi:hypothetical protein
MKLKYYVRPGRHISGTRSTSNNAGDKFGVTSPRIDSLLGDLGFGLPTVLDLDEQERLLDRACRSIEEGSRLIKWRQVLDVLTGLVLDEQVRAIVPAEAEAKAFLRLLWVKEAVANRLCYDLQLEASPFNSEELALLREAFVAKNGGGEIMWRAVEEWSLRQPLDSPTLEKYRKPYTSMWR